MPDTPTTDVDVTQTIDDALDQLVARDLARDEVRELLDERLAFAIERHHRRALHDRAVQRVARGETLIRRYLMHRGRTTTTSNLDDEALFIDATTDLAHAWAARNVSNLDPDGEAAATGLLITAGNHLRAELRELRHS